MPQMEQISATSLSTIQVKEWRPSAGSGRAGVFQCPVPKLIRAEIG